MKHLGDITKINWFEVEPVDCVTGGSPCQDLSVAGKRAGLAGERSGLYMEQIRCIKELRQQDVNNGRTGAMVRPRWMVWENVPGAFSSNGGKDFAAVLEEAVKIVEPQAPPIPVPDKGWPSAGCLSDVDGRWSIAWRVHDAQFWGVPQRRKRIALVCDFGGMSAPEVLFERKGLSGNFEQSGAEREETARTAGNGVASTITASYGTKWNGNAGAFSGGNFVIGFTNRGYSTGEKAETLQSDPHGAYPNVYAIDTYNHAITGDVACSLTAVGAGDPTKSGPSVLCLNDQGGSIMSVSEDVSGCLRAQEHGHQPICIEMKSTKNTVVEAGISPTLTARMGTGGNQVNAVLETYQQVTGPLMANSHPGSYCGQDAYSDMLVTPFAAGGYGKYEEGVGTLRASGDDYGGGAETLVTAVDVYNQSLSGDVSPSLTAACGGSNTSGGKVLTQTVRRLTPLECERLQGYPDGWTDIGEWVDSKGKKRKAADSPRYKALGNSIALPFWFWLLRRISAQYERPATLGRLFDGISGFCLSWARCNGAKNCRWSSEIEEFPMAVTRKHFGDEKTGEVGDIEKYL